MTGNLWSQLKFAAGAGILSGGYPFARNFYFVGRNAPQGVQRVDTLAACFNRLVDNDVVMLGPGAHEEGNLIIEANNITILGMGNRGSVFIEPDGANDEGVLVLGDDVTFNNVGIAKGAAGDYALSVGSQTVSPSRFRAYDCKIEGDGIAARLYGAGDVILEDCEFAWCGTGIQFRGNDIGFNTQIYIRKCRFHNFTDAGLGEFAAAQQVNNLEFLNSFMDQTEDGTEPTDFILLSDNANTGLIAGNQFAIATNSNAKLTIGSGIMWGPNGTEAGWSTARPA